MTTPAGPPGQDSAAPPADQAAPGRNGPSGALGTPEGSAGATEASELHHEEDEAGEHEDEHPSRREAKYRREARAAQEERDQLQKRLDNVLRSKAAELAGQVLEDGSDLWPAGVRLSDLIGEDGELDSSLVRAAAEQVLRDHRHWGRSRRTASGLKSGASNPSSEAPTTSWASVLRPET